MNAQKDRRSAMTEHCHSCQSFRLDVLVECCSILSNATDKSKSTSYAALFSSRVSNDHFALWAGLSVHCEIFDMPTAKVL